MQSSSSSFVTSCSARLPLRQMFAPEESRAHLLHNYLDVFTAVNTTTTAHDDGGSEGGHAATPPRALAEHLNSTRFDVSRYIEQQLG
eukprot:345851-Pleurochrysis_carterae.AAC.1